MTALCSVVLPTRQRLLLCPAIRVHAVGTEGMTIAVQNVRLHHSFIHLDAGGGRIL
jgi:hypothetical protein